MPVPQQNSVDKKYSGGKAWGRIALGALRLAAKIIGRHVPECVCADAHIEETRAERTGLMDANYMLFPNNVKQEK